jgi:hypothetical protein
MIEATELRIGNKIKWLHEEDESIVVVNSATINTIDYGNKHPEAEEFARGLWYEPIELTYEVLQQFGFQQDGFRQVSFDIAQGKFDYRQLTIDLNQGLIYIRQGITTEPRHKDDLIVVWNRDYTPNYYLHQLQNLYYTFTQKELFP